MTWDAHPNRAVFNLYAALLASGYDLTSVEADDPIAAIIEQIRSHRWDPSQSHTSVKRALRAGRQSLLAEGGDVVERFVSP